MRSNCRYHLHLAPLGKEADVAVLEELHGKFGYIDCGLARMNGDVQIIARMTVRAGRIAYDPSGLSMVEWEKARPRYFNNPSEGNPASATAEDLPQH